MLTKILTILALLLGAISLQAQEANQRIALPPMTKAPVIDGVISPQEWAGAAKVLGFMQGTGPLLEGRQGYTYIGYDADNLYLAVSTETPPNNQLLASVTARDANTVYDDSIEMWLDPDRANHIKGTGTRNLYQMIVNSLGVFLDAKTDAVNGIPNDGWDVKGQQFKQRVVADAHRWEVEMALPWKNFGIEKMVVDKQEIGFLLARNWKSPWAQNTFMPTGGFGDWRNYVIIALDPNAPVVQEDDLGPIYEPRFAYQTTVRNPGNTAQNLIVKTSVSSSDMPAVSKTDTLMVSPTQITSYQFNTSEGYLHQGATNRFSTQVTSVDGNTIYFRHTFSVGGKPLRLWDEVGAAEKVADYFIAYYPTTNQLAVKLDLTNVDGGAKYQSAAIQLLDGNGQVVASASMPLTASNGKTLFNIPNLPNGSYQVHTSISGDGVAAKDFDQSFKRQHYPWERSVLGTSEQVFSPFIPVTVQQNTIDVVLRKMTMNGFGLWSSVVSKNKELLAAPITIEYTTKAGAGQWATAQGVFKTRKPTLASYQAQAIAPAITLRTSSETEFDGCMKVKMELQPGAKPAQITSLWINIPLKDNMVSLMHTAIAQSCRSNLTGVVPKGTGQCWDSTKSGNGEMLGNMLPYIWLGGPERGLAWFADNDKGWVTDDEKPAMTLTRMNGVLTLRVYLINKPTTLSVPRTIVFGLQPSPTKPQPADVRSGRQIPQHGGAALYWGMYATYAGKYPADNDYSITDEMLSARIGQVRDEAFVRQWAARKYDAITDDKAWAKEWTRVLMAGYGWAVDVKNDPVSPYFEEHFMDQSTPEFQVFQDEWGIRDFTKRDWTTKPEKTTGTGVNFTRSYQDFALWHALQWFTRGFGLYCDNTFPHISYNMSSSDAYLRDDGQLQPSAIMWDMREYHKRLWVLEKQCQALTPYPLMISLHMTNANVLPVITWGDISLDNEWGWDGGNVPFPPEVLLTEMTGLQVGSYPHALYPVFGDHNNPSFLNKDEHARIEWGMRFTHEIMRVGHPDVENIPLEKLVRAFGYGKPGVAALNYWNNSERAVTQPGISVPNTNVKWIGLWKPASKELLVVLVNWEKTPQPTTVTLMTAPKDTNLAVCHDAETGQSLPTTGFTLKPYAVRVLKFTAK